jgi:DNA polymerase-1
MAFIEIAGIALGAVHCTLQACRLMLGEHATSLADGAEAFLDLKLDKAPQTSDWNAPHLTKRQIEYAAIDAVVAWRIAGKVLPYLHVQRAAYEIQMRAVPAVMRMEMRGFKLDVEAHARLIKALAQRRTVAEQRYCEACRECGHAELADRVPSTPAQKAALLTAFLSGDELARWRKTKKSGALSTERSELLRAAHYPPILALVDLSRIDKLLSSFGQTLTVLVSPVTGRIHAHYRVAGTNTGRASCSGPNLQNIPRTPDDPDDPIDFRALFVPEPGCVIVVADYSSMELRAAAHIYGDPVMTRAFEEGQDLHKITAARMTGKAIEDVTREERKGAKAVNFGAIYGIGAASLVQSAWRGYQIVLDLYEAKRWLVAFTQTFPTFARGRAENYERCAAARRILIGKDAAQGFGRVFPFSRLTAGDNGYTTCCNLPVQGACADAAMLALAYVDDRLFDAGIDGGPVAWLHDEIVLEVPEDQPEQAAEILKQAMIDGFAETFPGAPLNGLVEPHIGPNWGEAKQ